MINLFTFYQCDSVMLISDPVASRKLVFGYVPDVTAVIGTPLIY